MSAQSQDLRTRWIAAIRSAAKGEPLVKEPSIAPTVEETFNVDNNDYECCNCFGGMCCSDN